MTSDSPNGDRREQQQQPQPATPRKRGRPKVARRSDTGLTPFAEVLTEWMWAQRPRPWSIPQVAQRLGLSRVTVNGWINRGRTPPYDTMITVLDSLGIPSEALETAYERHRATSGGTSEQPTLEAAPGDDAPQPRPYVRPPSPDDATQQLLDVAAVTLREQGIPPETIERVLQHMRERAAGMQQFARNIAAEHAPTDGDQPDATRRTQRKKAEPANHTHG